MATPLGLIGHRDYSNHFSMMLYERSERVCGKFGCAEKYDFHFLIRHQS